MAEQSYGTNKDATDQDFCNIAELMAQSICVAITNNNGWVWYKRLSAAKQLRGVGVGARSARAQAL